jgi:hypothetical protein
LGAELGLSLFITIVVLFFRLGLIFLVHLHVRCVGFFCVIILIILNFFAKILLFLTVERIFLP